MENKLIDQIRSFEETAKLLEPQSLLRQNWIEDITAFAHQFIDDLPKTKAYLPIDQIENKLNLKLGPQNLQAILDELKSDMMEQGLNPASGGHLGYIPGGGIYAGALGDFLAAICNQYAGIYYGGPGAVKIENELIRWMCQIMDYPKGSLGNLTSGGSIANLIAIVTAREAKNIKAIDIPQCCIYLTEQVHHCVHKAIRIAGLAECQIRTIPMDTLFKMDTKFLEKQIKTDVAKGLKPFLLVGTAGTTDTGAIDPLKELSKIAKEYDIWYHIDAAYGGFFILAKNEISSSFEGIGESDSLAIDPHKGLFLSYGLGAVLIKDVKSQYNAHYYRAAYMQDTLDTQDELSPADLSPELTKHFRGLRLWMALKLHGIEPFQACISEKILLCRYFYQKVKDLGFRVGPAPELSVCIYRYEIPGVDSDWTNKQIVDYVVKDGTVFVSSTNIDGIFWIRIAILSFRTHQREIDCYLKTLEEAVNYVKSL